MNQYRARWSGRPGLRLDRRHPEPYPCRARIPARATWPPTCSCSSRPPHPVRRQLNNGFVSDFSNTLSGADAGRPVIPGTVATDIMGMFTGSCCPSFPPARGYAVCDQWSAPAPTETFPNRAFASAATSQGHMDDSTSKYTSQSIFGLLSAHGLNWSIYGYDNDPLTRLDFPDTTDAAESHFGQFDDFKAAAAGTLGCYTFLEPSWGSSGNSQHPNYDVALGEQLINDVYYALRNSPAGTNTAHCQLRRAWWLLRLRSPANQRSAT